MDLFLLYHFLTKKKWDARNTRQTWFFQPRGPGQSPPSSMIAATAFPVAIAIAVAVAFTAAAEVSHSPAGCCIDASTSRPLDLASASQNAHRGPVASCPLAPLFPFAPRLPAGCRVICYCAPPPRATFCWAAAPRVHP